MVRKENVQRYGNSLLQTATSKRMGPGRFASLVMRGTAKPPVKKIKVVKSDESRVSDLTGSMIDEIRPAMIKEVQVRDVEVESSVFGMSMNSGASSNFSVSQAFGKDSPVVGEATKTTPQPSAFKTPLRKEIRPFQKKSMEIQPGIKISAPSPMSLDRVEVQMGQEHTAPESNEYKQQHDITLKKEQKALKKKEYHKAKEEARQKIKEQHRKEQGEGFETQLEFFDSSEPAGDKSAPKKKSLVKKILGKIMPKSPKGKGPMTADEARTLARQAIQKSKKTSNGQSATNPPLAGTAGTLPVEEITTAKEDSISDLDSSARKDFPVREIRMNDDDQARDDESISTIGLAHVLERTPPGALNSGRFERKVRDPSPTDELDPTMRNSIYLPSAPGRRMVDQAGLPLSTHALIDQIDSGTMTEDAEAATNTLGRCGNPRPQKQLNHTENKQIDSNTKPKKVPFGFVLAGMCMHTTVPSGPESNSQSNIQNGGTCSIVANAIPPPPEERGQEPDGPLSLNSAFGDALDAALSTTYDKMQSSTGYSTGSSREGSSAFSAIDLKKSLSPIEEDEAISPMHETPLRNKRENVPELEEMPDLENEDPVSRATPKTGRAVGDSDGIIDLTNLASPNTDLANQMSPSTQDGVKGDKEKHSQNFNFDDYMDIAASKLNWKKDDDRYAVEGEESPRKVIVGHRVKTKGEKNSRIPVVQGVEINGKTKMFDEPTPKASGAAKSGENHTTLEDDHGTKESTQSSFEVYEHPEGEVVMWSGATAPAREPKKQSENSGKFAGHFSDGLFDLLSMDESVTRGRKKVPFLSEQPSSSAVGPLEKLGSVDAPVSSKNRKEPSRSAVGPLEKLGSVESPASSKHIKDDEGLLDFVFENAESVCSKEKPKAESLHKKNFNKMAAKTAGNGLFDIDDGDDTQSESSFEEEDAVRQDGIDPSLGVMCGAVPLYFMYSMQGQGPNEEEKKKRKARGSRRKLKSTSKGTKSKTKKQSKRDESPSQSRRNKKSPSKKGMQLSSDNDGSDSDEEQRPEDPVVPKRIEDHRSHRLKTRHEYREKVLLEKDDAYWDTLSTIASTKDRSSVSGKNLEENIREPGPIPVEITMTSKAAGVEIINVEAEVEPATDAEMELAIGKLASLINDENSTGSLSQRLAALETLTRRFDGRDPTRSSATTKVDSVRLSKAASASVGDSIQGPPSHTSPIPLEEELAADAEMELAIGKLASLINDENSTGSLSQRLAALETLTRRFDGRDPARSNATTKVDSVRLSKAASASVGDSIQGPPSHTSPSPLEKYVDEKKVTTGLINGIESHASAAPSAIDAGKNAQSGPQDDPSEDNSGLLLALSRSDGNENDRAQTSTPQSSHRSVLMADLDALHAPRPSNGRPFNITTEEGSRGVRDSLRSYLPPSPHSGTTSSSKAYNSGIESTLDESSLEDDGAFDIRKLQAEGEKASKMEGVLPHHTGFVSSRFMAAPLEGILSGSKLFSSWKNSNRSVSWGYEEIYEAPEALQSPAVDESVHSPQGLQTVAGLFSNPWTSNAPTADKPKASIHDTRSEASGSIDDSGSDGDNNKAVISAVAAAAATAAIEFSRSESPGTAESTSIEDSQTANSSHETFPQLVKGDANIEISDEDEQELISRTLQLSKELLSSMTAQDLEGADDEVVKSLLSFGTEDSAARSSLPDLALLSAVAARRAAPPPTSTMTVEKPVPVRTAPSKSEYQNPAAVMAAAEEEQEEASPAATPTASASTTTLEDATTLTSSGQEGRSLEALADVGVAKARVPGSVRVDSTKAPAEKPPMPTMVRSLNANTPAATAAAATASRQAEKKRAPTPTPIPVNLVEPTEEAVPASSRFSDVIPSFSRRDESSSKTSEGEEMVYTIPQPSPQQLQSPRDTTSGSVSTSIRAIASGISQDSPIDVEDLLTNYDQMAHHLMDENAELKVMTNGSHSIRTSETVVELPAGGGYGSLSTSTGESPIVDGAIIMGSPRTGLTRLDQLRTQRAQALARLNGISNHTFANQNSKNNTNSNHSSGAQANASSGSRVSMMSGNVGPDGAAAAAAAAAGGGTPKNRVSQYGRTQRPSSTGRVALADDMSATDRGGGQGWNDGDRRARSALAERPVVVQEPSSYPDLETSSTTSSSQTTPSMKARELRRQLDDALKASKRIRDSQEQLGSELQSFKHRFYQKNDQMEDQAMKAIGGL